MKFFTKNANLNLATGFRGNVTTKSGHKKEKKTEEKAVEKASAPPPEEKKQEAPPLNIPPPPPCLNIKAPPLVGGLGNFGAPKQQETVDRNRYENARNELRKRLDQKKEEELFEECIPIKKKIQVI